MKNKFLLFVILLFGSVSFVSAQTVADFEDGSTGSLTIHVMGNGDYDNDAMYPVDSTFSVVDNPDASGINTSAKVMQFIRRGTNKGGQPWGGFWAAVDPNIDVTTNKYVHVMVYKSRISPIKFKLEGGPKGTLEIFSTNEQQTTGSWEDMVFAFDTLSGNYPTCAFMPDFEDPLTMADDQVIYFDNIRINNDPNPLTATTSSNVVISDFEDGTSGPLTMHVMGNGDYDNDAMYPVDSTFSVVDNPDASGINTSAKVMQFIRRGTNKGGQPWGGFWAAVDPNIDVTAHKYIHVKVYKPRISPIKFKLEGGPKGTLEIFSTNEQQTTGAWEDMVFAFDTLSGNYPTCAFMPDFEDPLTMAEDQVIYFDDIIINDDPNPITTTGIVKHAGFEFNLYPNPVSNVLNLQLNENMKKMAIFNLMGQKMFELQNVNRGATQINIADFPKGIYLLKLINNTNLTSVKKFIKK
jgi:hypothetical protein